MKLPLPAETREIFNDEEKILGASNIGLLFNKYVYCWQTGWQMNEEHIKGFRKSIAESVSKLKLPKDKDYVAALNRRHRTVIESLNHSGWHIELFELTTDTRLIIGLGGTSVIETGMTLHPLYGFPYLPGSGLKGLARAYAEIAIEHEPTEEAFRKELKKILGSDYKDPQLASENTQGKVFFMYGLPTSFPKLELDIMNPHYGDYYQGKTDSKGNAIPPADYLNPVPVTFLTVAKGEKFSFAIFSREKELVNKAKEWLMGGLTELGAGGKTNVGYGYFRSAHTSNIEKVNNKHQGTSQNPVPQTTLWQNVSLTWYPGNTTLTATTKDNKAELKLGSDRGKVPENLHKKLFVKRETVKADVTVELDGNIVKIIKIEVPS
ncbi:MAG: type III-B CRISPR module RAMP protein Cmr6 [Nitrospirae bacterium]|nr:type III-B CRISPR module RAMP protein Cmr6 [Nitrospirota bacterium]